MNKVLLKLTAKMLEVASEEFSNHGCNDLYEDTWESADMGQSDKDELLKDMRETSGYDEDDLPCLDSVGDTQLMDYLRKKLLQQAENGVGQVIKIGTNIGDINL